MDINDGNKNISLFFNRNNSTGNLIERKNINKTNYIPENRMEEYLCEYYQNLYNENDKDSYNSLVSNSINNKTINIPNSKMNSIITPIENTKKVSNKSLNDNFMLPDDLLIEYNNRKRLDELRKKYLSSSSLLFLRKKNESKINNNYPKEEAKNNEKIIKENQNFNINYEDKKEPDLKNEIFDLKFKYEQLQKEFNNLAENKNKFKGNYKNKKIKKEKETPKNTYKKYLIEENNKLKKINDNYEIILEMLISYINEANRLYFNMDQIEYFNLRQNILNKNTKCINELSDFLEKCKENLANNSNNSNFKNKTNKNYKTNLNKKELKNKNSKIKNKMRYTYSTISFNKKIANNSVELIRNIKSATINKTRNDKIKKSRITYTRINKK